MAKKTGSPNSASTASMLTGPSDPYENESTFVSDEALKESDSFKFFRSLRNDLREDDASPSKPTNDQTTNTPPSEQSQKTSMSHSQENRETSLDEEDLCTTQGPLRVIYSDAFGPFIAIHPIRRRRARAFCSLE